MFRNLNAEMSRRGLTRRVMAKKINMTPNTLTRKLNGLAVFTLDEVYKIRDMLDEISPLDKDMNLDKLFEQSGNPEPTTKERK